MKPSLANLKRRKRMINKTNLNREKITDPSVTSPQHYQGIVECWDLIRDRLGEEGFMNYCTGNVYKYLFRHKNNENIRDLKKCRVYLDNVIEYYENL